MAYTLADYARVQKDPLKAGVVDIFRRESSPMDLLPWETIDTLKVQALRTKTLPAVEWRKIGETWSGGSGTVEPVDERVFDMGGKVDIDKLLIKSKTVVDQRALQTQLYTTALAYEFNNVFINGDPVVVDEDQPFGLWRRIKDFLSSGQTILGGAVDISPDSAALSVAFDTFLDKIQELMHAVEGHKPDALFTNDTLYLRLLSAIRQKGLFATVEDSFGRKVATYGPGGPMIYDIGWKADQTTRIMGNVELTDGSALTGGGSTSVYAVRFGEGFLKGIQLYDMDVQDVGLLEDRVNYRTVIDWPVGLFLVNPRSIARLCGVVAA